MTIATVLTLLDGGPGSEATLRTALAVAQRHESYVEALHLRPGSQDMVPIVAEGLSGSAMEQIIRNAELAAEERAEKAHKLFQDVATELSLPVTQAEAVVDGGGFSVAWHEMIGDRIYLAAGRARLFDLVVTSRPVEDDGAGAWTCLEPVLFDSGRPVLVVPPKLADASDQSRPGRHVAIAWNDTREAARGAWAAEPFLQAAEVVSLITITDSHGDANPAELAKALRHRKVEAQVVTLAARNKEVGEVLLDQAGDLGADLLVMGAYGHSRLREFVFGGATQTVLRHATLPVLMTH